MLTRVKRPITLQEALGPQVPGVKVPREFQGLDEKGIELLNEYRMDLLRPIHPGLGLHYVEDPDLPWLQSKTVKVGIGDHPQFGSPDNWLRIGSYRAQKKDFDFTIDLNKLILGDKVKVNFIFCYHVIPFLKSPVGFLRMLKAAILPGEVCCIVEQDSEQALREGKGFVGLLSHEQVGRMIDEAGFSRKLDVQFRIVGLPEWDTCDKGWFASP